MYLIETKGYVGAEVAQKDRAATIWCENATALTGSKWRYRRVNQDEFVRALRGESCSLSRSQVAARLETDPVEARAQLAQVLSSSVISENPRVPDRL
jgi:hypothetical protein